MRSYKRLKRYRQVTATLFRYGFDDIADRIGAHSIWGRFRKQKAATEIPTPQRLRLAMSDLGPTFVKFGQLLSTRPDILPERFILELEKLQDDVPPFPFDEVVRIIREELEGAPDEVFKSFEKKPLASGSIAQVHRAKLRDGTAVAVKVQRPGVKAQLETDLEILTELAVLMEKHAPETKPFRPADLVRQFTQTVRRELDFISEAQAIQRFRLNFAGDPTCYVPEVYWDYSTSKVLTTDEIRGVKATDFKELERRGMNRKLIARNGVRAAMREIFEFRLFHADPHPGNIFVLEGNVIAPVDFGIVGRLDDETTEQLVGLLQALLQRNIPRILKVFRKLGVLQGKEDLVTLRYDLEELIDRYYGLPLEKIEAETVLHDLLWLIRRHSLSLPINLALLVRMLAVSAGVARRIDPELDILAEATPFFRSFLISRFDPKKKARDMLVTWKDYQETFRSFPGDIEEILSKVKKGEMLVSLHHEGLSRFILEMDRSSNRLAFGLIIAALIIGSSFVMQLQTGPTLFGLPAIGLGGYLIAAVLGLLLVAAILRSGRL